MRQMVNGDNPAQDGVLMLGASAVRDALPLGECIDALEAAFRDPAAAAVQSFVGGVAATDGKYHVKAALTTGDRPVFVVKTNANFPANPERHGLPTIQGVVALFSATDGRVLALVDSIALTIIRTAAATGLAVRHLSRPDAHTVAVIGCGAQARAQAEAVCLVRPIRRIQLYDSRSAAADALADELRTGGFDARPAGDLATALHGADVVVTCTSATRAFLSERGVGPGTIVAAVGADNQHKQEITPSLLAASLVIVDDLEQCAAIGDLHHAIAAGVVDRSHVAASLFDVVRTPERFAWQPGRTVVFDSTGIPIEDAVGTLRAYDHAMRTGHGRVVSLG